MATQAGQKAENLTPDEACGREGINAEQIVIKIIDQGWCDFHGDHYHYYNGRFPYDAIISEEPHERSELSVEGFRHCQ